MRFEAGDDLCLGFFKEAYDAGAITFPERARVLELGCAEADWLAAMHGTRPDLHLTGIDQRFAPRQACDRFIEADVLTTRAFEPAEFDAIVAVSMVEWAGLGHYGDPVSPDGDIITMQRARDWIQPDGLMYLDSPYCPQNSRDLFIMRNQLRAYTERGLHERLLTNRWQPIWRQHFYDTGHPDGPYVALVVKPV